MGNVVYGVTLHVPTANSYVVRTGIKHEDGTVSYPQPYENSVIVKEYKNPVAAEKCADKLNVERLQDVKTNA